MIAMEFDTPVRPLVEALMKRGLLAKDTHENTIRFAPPLTITPQQCDQACEIIRRCVAGFPA